MKIIGFNFTKILAEKEGPAGGKVNVSMSINVSNIEKQKLSAIGQDVIKAEFNFSIKYEKMANLNFKGEIYFTAEEEKLKEVVKKWKDKKVPEDIRVPLYNLILTKCNIRALELEDELGLPTHVPLPKVSNKQPETSYVK